jgi:sulfate permease, SulP family
MVPSPAGEPTHDSSYWRTSARLTLGSLRGMFDRSTVPANIGAGITVALVALPLNLALAIACGLPASVGLVTGIVGGVVGTFLGASRFQVTGPEVALAPITLEIVSRHGFDGLLAVTFMAGLMQIALGALRVGRLVHAIPVPVIGGFLAAVGWLVLDSQLPRLLGLPSEVGLLSGVRDATLLGQISAPSVLLGSVVIATLLLLPRVGRRIPAHLVGVAIAVGSVVWLGLRLPTIPPIEGVLPRPGLPRFGDLDIIALLPEAAALALLASIDSLLCAVSVDARTGSERTRSDQELVAQGVANLGSACFGGMPVAAAVVRSMALVEAGASSRLAPLVQSVLLGVVLVALAPFVSVVPIVALAAILLVIGVRLINVRQLFELWHLSRFEAAVFLITAVSIVVTDFVTGVITGTVAALAHFARQQRLALRPREGGRSHAETRLPQTAHLSGKLAGRIVRLEGPLFFGSQDRIEEALLSRSLETELIVDLTSVSSIDVSGAMALAASLERAAERGVHVHLLTRGVNSTLDWVIARCRQKGIRLTTIGHAHEPESSLRPPSPASAGLPWPEGHPASGRLPDVSPLTPAE